MGDRSWGEGSGRRDGRMMFGSGGVQAKVGWVLVAGDWSRHRRSSKL
jgi:hypothetical protein